MSAREHSALPALLIPRLAGNAGQAVAAYNAGPAAVEKYGGVPPYAETETYVRNVLASYEEYKARIPH